MHEYLYSLLILSLMVSVVGFFQLPYRAKLWIEINFIRRFLSPITYWFQRFTKYRGELPDKWDEIKDLSKDEFYNEIEFNAKYDYLKHEVEFSPQQKNFFFLGRETSRDCTSWSRMWRWWGEYHELPTWEIAIDDVDNYTQHALTVIEFDDGYELFDYWPTNKREKSIEKALKNNVVGYINFEWVRLKG